MGRIAWTESTVGGLSHSEAAEEGPEMGGQEEETGLQGFPSLSFTKPTAPPPAPCLCPPNEVPLG